MAKTKYIFVTGGIVSGIGKGITVASLGTLLKARGLKIGLIKLDPYFNIDAGTMNPFQHGEVFVTDDGAETDLDLGHYERFTDLALSQDNNTTSGRIYQTVLDRERKGDFLGKTIQLIPHVTDEIKAAIKRVGAGADVVIAEIGGTAGDIEAEVFLESIRQFRRDVGANNVCYIHVTKMDYIYPSDEPKTKPTQQTVQVLRERGIQPNILVIRTKNGLPQDLRAKIALFCDVDVRDIIPAPNANSLYDIPLNLERDGLGKRVCGCLRLRAQKPNLAPWHKIAKAVHEPRREMTVGLVGKYIEHPDAYLSVIEALQHGAIANRIKIKIVSIDSEELEKVSASTLLDKLDGIVVPGGFGNRGIEGKIKAIKFAREKKIPFLGLCLGLQCAVIEFARDVCQLKRANSTEFDKKTPHPVIDILPEQRAIDIKGGTMRLGSCEALLHAGTLARRLYQKAKVSERHRHRYEVNPQYHEILTSKGLVISGVSPSGTLAEFIELPRAVHPFFSATQAHPEFKSRPTKPAPLFAGFIKAMLA